MADLTLSTLELKEHPLIYLLERRTVNEDLRTDKRTILLHKPLKVLSISEIIYFLKQRIGVSFIAVHLVGLLELKLKGERYLGYYLDSNEDSEKEELKEAIKELLLIDDDYWQENPVLYANFSNLIKDEKYWISSMVPKYVFDHFMQLKLKGFVWTDERTRKLQEWLDTDSASGHGAVVSEVLQIRRALDNKVKVVSDNGEEILDFDHFINKVVNKLSATDYILTEIKNEIRIRN